MAVVANACKILAAVGVLTRNDGSCNHDLAPLQINCSIRLDRQSILKYSRRAIDNHTPAGRLRAERAEHSTPKYISCGVHAALRETAQDHKDGEFGTYVQPLESSPLAPITLPPQPTHVDVTQPGWETLYTALRSYLRDVGTGWEKILKHRNPGEALGSVLANESKLIYLMMCNDISIGLLPFWCLGVNMLAVSPFLQTGDWHAFSFQAAATMSKEVLYSFLYLYCFNLANQYMGAAGDVIDKPWRPIPSGLMTREGALARFFLSNLLYGFVSWHLGVLHWTALWEIVIVAQYFGYEKDDSSGVGGLGRSISMAVGNTCISLVGVQLVTPMTPVLQFWGVMRGLVAGNHHWMQDFRDVEGDRKVGRTTFPLVFGLENARKLMAFIFMMDPIFLHYVVMKDSGYSTPQLLAEGFGVLLCAILAYRVMNFKTPADDHYTYTIWLAVWHNFMFLVVGPAFLVGVH